MITLPYFGERQDFFWNTGLLRYMLSCTDAYSMKQAVIALL